jgi:hypothetical protein
MMTAFSCPTQKAASHCSGATVENVALASDAKGCATPCSDEKAAIQNVALTTEAKDCSTPCSGETAGQKTAVQSVAMKTEAKADCPLGCSGEMTAAVTSVAAKTDAKDCSTPCSAKASDCSGDKAAVTSVAMTTEAKDCSTPCAIACETQTASACSGDTAGFAVPSMAFRVGDTDMSCPASAKAMAAEHKADMGFVVQGVAYTTEAEAKVAHMVAMQRFTESLTRVSLVVNGETVECAEKAAACKTACDSTKIQYQVGPVMFDNAEDAVRAAAAAHAAMQSVKMSYAVNGQATACSVDAKAKSTSCGSPVEFVVNGAKTACTKTADYLLTQERMAAAVAAMQKTIG